MKKMTVIAIAATGIGMLCAMASGNTNALLANGFLMLTIATVSGRN